MCECIDYSKVFTEIKIFHKPRMTVSANLNEFTVINIKGNILSYLT